MYRPSEINENAHRAKPSMAELYLLSVHPVLPFCISSQQLTGNGRGQSDKMLERDSKLK
jgi:hypothetical protein